MRFEDENLAQASEERLRALRGSDIAMIRRPKQLIADEPTTALDVTVQAQVLELLRELTTESATAVILVTHNLGLVAELADRVLVLYAGQIAERATAVELFDAAANPYRRGLPASVPQLDDDERRRLAYVPGSVPAPGACPHGCRFSTRPRQMIRLPGERHDVIRLAHEICLRKSSPNCPAYIGLM